MGLFNDLLGQAKHDDQESIIEAKGGDKQLVEGSSNNLLKQLLEAGYKEGAEFDADLDKLDAALDTIKTILNDKKFAEHVALTDENYGTELDSEFSDMLDVFKKLNEAWIKFNKEVHKAV